MTTLVIIESPGKRETLEQILGAGFEVQASFGHVRDLPEHELGVQAPDFRPHYVTEDDRAKATLARLRKAAQRADRVLLATDCDREGEAIAWHVAEALGLSSRERLTYQSVTASAVNAALAATRPINLDLVRAQEARRVLDRLVGYTVSPALSDAAGERLSAGRVQSPAVRLLVERERAIRSFVPTIHYGVELTLEGDRPWSATWQPDLPEGEEYVLDRKLAERVARVTQVRVDSFKDSEAKTAPPPPFTTSTLQQRAQTALKLKPKVTMELAQKLYERGAITYMRTDSVALSDEAYQQIVDYAQAHRLPLAAKRRTWKAKASAQEAHEAIRPTHLEQLDVGDTEQERALYKLIWARTLACQLADATFAVRTVELSAPLPASSREGTSSPLTARFLARGRTLIDPGWKALFDEPEDDDAEKEPSTARPNPIPKLAAGATVRAPMSAVDEKKTKAPGRYTIASLIKALEAAGVGRPSTYVSILENIAARGYLAEDKKGQLSATPKAEALVDRLVGTFAFADLEYTSALELALDDIAEGRKAYVDVLAQAHDQLAGELARLPAGPTHACPECQAPLRRRTSKKGPFWGCSNYPKCNVALPDVDGVPGAREAASAHTCPQCSKPLRRRQLSKEKCPKGRGFDFWGCTGFPKCSASFKPGADGAPLFP